MDRVKRHPLARDRWGSGVLGLPRRVILIDRRNGLG